jgi:hypothetical protein
MKTLCDMYVKKDIIRTGRFTWNVTFQPKATFTNGVSINKCGVTIGPIKFGYSCWDKNNFKVLQRKGVAKSWLSLPLKRELVVKAFGPLDKPD